MDITIQHPWFKRALGPLIPSRLFDQFFGEGLLEYDLLPLFSSTISPYYRQSLFRSVLESGISEVRALRLPLLFLPLPPYTSTCSFPPMACQRGLVAVAPRWGAREQGGPPAKHSPPTPSWARRETLAREKASLRETETIFATEGCFQHVKGCLLLPSYLPAIWRGKS